MNRDLNKVTSDQKMQRPRAIWLVLMGIVTLLLIVYWLSQSLGAIRQVVRWRFSSISHLPVDEMKKHLRSGESILLIDVRESEEYAVSHLPGARHVAFSDPDRDQKLLTLLKASTSDQLVAIYCTVGWRSAEVVQGLSSHEGIYLKNLHNLDGALFQWANNGYELIDVQGMPTNRVHPYSNWWEGLLKASVMVSYK